MDGIDTHLDCNNETLLYASRVQGETLVIKAFICFYPSYEKLCLKVLTTSD